MQTDPNAQTPLTIGLFGVWGSGKTTLMDMLDAKLAHVSETGLAKFI
jgi:pantothenate kinase-related protein Tda10